MYQDAKKVLSQKGYSSLSELIRDSLRKVLYPQLTENGFTSEFEEEVLRSAAEPLEGDVVIETEEELKRFFDQVHQRVEKKRHAQGS